MSFTKDIPEVPTLEEAIYIAGALDEIGLYDDASLMDEFAKIAAQYNGNLIKQAGLWSAIWNRIGGLTKRMFFKEYRALYSKAKEAHEKIAERMKESVDQFKEAKHLLKNYELVGWREKVITLPVYVKDLMADYEAAFGRLIAFTFKLQGKEGIPEGTFDISKITPPGEKGEGIDPETGEVGTVKEEKKEVKPGEKQPVKLPPGAGWRRVRHDITSIAENDDDMIAIRKEYYTSYIGRSLIEGADGNVRINTKWGSAPGGKFPSGLVETLGTNVWKKEKEDAEWVYLKKFMGERVIRPQEEVGDRPPPPLPHIDLSGKEKIPAGGVKVEKEEVDKKDMESKEKVVENKVEQGKYNKMRAKYKDYTWISTLNNKFKLINLSKEDLKPGESIVGDPKLVEKLFDALFIKKRRIVSMPKEYTKAELINKILFKK